MVLLGIALMIVVPSVLLPVLGQALRANIPGQPGTDYPVLDKVQATSFSCSGLVLGGYYADPDQGCQAYHVCVQDSSLDLYPVSFLCPNGTLFNQEVFVCDWWFNVDCSASVGLYAGVAAAFGGGELGEVSSCPAPSSGPDCGGSVSNCWSPGQRDTDCPNNGLCCFDGCSDLCLQSAPPVVQPVEAEAAPLPQVLPAPTTQGYSYPVPEVPLELPKPQRPPPGLPTLYGAPPVNYL